MISEIYKKQFMERINDDLMLEGYCFRGNASRWKNTEKKSIVQYCFDHIGTP